MLLLCTLASTAIPSHAQQDPGCEAARAVMGSLFGNSRIPPCNSSGPQGPQGPGTTAPMTGTRPSGRGVDTPENSERVRASLVQIYGSLDPTLPLRDATAGMDACITAMRPFENARNFMNSGFNELNARCNELMKPMYQAYVDRARAGYRANEQAKADADKAAEQQEADRVARIVAELKAGQRQPTSCAEYMVTKGVDPAGVNAPVMHVAYQAPTGLGLFRGNVERIEGSTIFLSGRIPDVMRLTLNPPDHMIVKTNRDTKVYAGERVRPNGLLEGFATQSGTQAVTLTTGRVVTVAVLTPVCMQPR